MANSNETSRLADMGQLNARLKDLLSTLHQIDTICKRNKGEQINIQEALKAYSQEAADTKSSLQAKADELSATIAQINEFLADADNAIERINSIEQKQDSFAKASFVEALQKKVKKIDSISSDLQNYAQRSEMESQIEELRDALTACEQNEAKLKRTIEELTRKVRQLEKEQKKYKSLQEQIEALAARITQLEDNPRIPIATVASVPSTTATITSTNDEGSVTTMTQTVETTVSHDGNQPADGKQMITQMISQGSAQRQAIIMESIIGISAALTRHGVE